MADAVYPARAKSGKAHGCGGRKANIDEAALRAAYEGGMPMEQCAVKFGVTSATVCHRLNRLGVVARKDGWRKGAAKKSVDCDELRRLYIDEGLGVYECAARLGVGGATISKRLKEFGIPARPEHVLPGPNSPMHDGAPSSAENKAGYMRAYWQKNREKLIAQNRLYKEVHKEELAGPNRERSKRRYHEQKPLVQVYQRERYLRQREKLIATAAEGKRRRMMVDPDGERAKVAAAARRRRAKDLETARAKQRIYETCRRRENVKVALRIRMTNMIRSALRHNGSGKGGRSWKQLVPYTVDALRDHLQKTIPPGFTWDDFLSGTLHIDHKTPHAAFHYSLSSDYDFSRCWAIENLQLLPDKENKRKGAKLSAPFQPTLL